MLEPSGTGQADGPLDLRFDQTKGITAWDFLMSASREDSETDSACLESGFLACHILSPGDHPGHLGAPCQACCSDVLRTPMMA